MAKKNSVNYRSHLIIPDSHAKPGVSNERFEWLGNVLLDRQPDVIVDIGDSADMASLCKYDIGQLRAEGRRYSDDIRAYHDAMRKMLKPIEKYNNTHTKWKKKTYRPEMIKTRGNHEHRIIRAVQDDPAMYGHLTIDDLREEEFGWKCYDFLKPACIDNIAYQHYFTSGVMGRPIGGINHARSLVAKNYMSCVQGHSHMRDFWEDCDAVGRKLFGLVVGCFFGHDEDYTTENRRFWRGLVQLHGVHGGQGEPEFLGYEEVRRNYG
jgi:hypothetical protein